MARPPTYQSDDERPITVSVRIPRELYAQAKQYVALRRTTLTEVLLDGLRLRLETPADPRDIVVSHDNTVIQELQAMVDAAVQAALAKERRTSTPEAVPDTPVLGEVLAVYEDMAAFLTEDEDEAQRPPLPERRYYENNTVIQEKDVAVQEDGTDTAPAAARTRRGVPKLTPRQIRALRDKRHRGVSVPALMDEYGISRASVFRYLQSEKR